jgi:hypothetical protein
MTGEDLLVAQGLLAPPRPARLVSIGRRSAGEYESVEAWRLVVTGDERDFSGDEQVLQQLRDVASASPGDYF